MSSPALNVLPAEVRLMIYGNLLSQDGIPTPTTLQSMRLSRSVYYEFQAQFWRDADVTISLTRHQFDDTLFQMELYGARYTMAPSKLMAVLCGRRIRSVNILFNLDVWNITSDSLAAVSTGARTMEYFGLWGPDASQQLRERAQAFTDALSRVYHIETLTVSFDRHLCTTPMFLQRARAMIQDFLYEAHREIGDTVGNFVFAGSPRNFYRGDDRERVEKAFAEYTASAREGRKIQE